MLMKTTAAWLALAIVAVPMYVIPNSTIFLPRVVAKQSFLNQSAGIPITTIFTPNTDGDFQVTMYGTVNGGNPCNSMTFVSGTIYWTDEYNSPVFSGGAAQCTAQSAFVASFHAKGGTPIQFKTDYQGEMDNSP